MPGAQRQQRQERQRQTHAGVVGWCALLCARDSPPPSTPMHFFCCLIQHARLHATRCTPMSRCQSSSSTQRHGTTQHTQSASAFMAQSAWASRAGCFINLESIGPGGSPIVFQHAGAWTIEAFARGAVHPRGAIVAQVGACCMGTFLRTCVSVCLAYHELLHASCALLCRIGSLLCHRCSLHLPHGPGRLPA